MEMQTIESERRLTSAQVRQLCGGISDMTLWRWAQDRGFPEPIYIGTRKYWRETEVIGWLNSRPSSPTKTNEPIAPPWLD